MGEPTYTIELTKRAIEQLEKIKKLYEKGIIDENEYKAARLKALGL